MDLGDLGVFRQRSEPCDFYFNSAADQAEFENMVRSEATLLWYRPSRGDKAVEGEGSIVRPVSNKPALFYHGGDGIAGTACL